MQKIFLYGLTDIFNSNPEKIFIMKYNTHTNIMHFLSTCNFDLKKFTKNINHNYLTDKEKLEVVKKILGNYKSYFINEIYEEIQDDKSLIKLFKKLNDIFFLDHNYSSLFFNLCFFNFIKEISPYIFETKLKKTKVVTIEYDQNDRIIKTITPIETILESFNNLVQNTNIDPLFFICNPVPNINSIEHCFVGQYFSKTYINDILNLNKKFNFSKYEKKYQYYTNKQFPNFNLYTSIVEDFFTENLDNLVDNIGFIPFYFLTEEKNLLNKYKEDDIMLSFFIDNNNDYNNEHLEKINFIFNSIKTISTTENLDFVCYNVDSNDPSSNLKLFSVILKKEEEQNFVNFIKTVYSINQKIKICYNYRFIFCRHTLKNLKKIINFFDFLNGSSI